MAKGSTDGLYKRGGIWWVTRDPITKARTSTKCKDFEAAKRWRKARELYAADPTYAAAQAADLNKWLGLMLAVKKSKSEGTQHFYRTKAGHLARLMGPLKMAQITPDAVDRYIAQRTEEGASHHTVAKELCALLQTLKIAKRRGEFPGDLSTIKPIGFGPGYTPREGVLEHADEAKLMEACSLEEWAAVALILGTSARAGEVARAEYEDWDGKHWYLRGTKTEGSRRYVPMLRPWQVDYCRVAHAHLPLTLDVSRAIPAACVRAGIPRLTPNDLRRTCATRLVEDGVEPYTVAKVTGHSDLSMLRRVYDRSNRLHRTDVTHTESNGGGAEAENLPKTSVAPARLELARSFGTRDFKAGRQKAVLYDSEHLGHVGGLEIYPAGAGLCTDSTQSLTRFDLARAAHAMGVL